MFRPVSRARRWSRLQHRTRHSAAPAIPCPESLQRNPEQLGELPLAESEDTAQLAKRGHDDHTMPSAARVVKRALADVANDQRGFAEPGPTRLNPSHAIY